MRAFPESPVATAEPRPALLLDRDGVINEDTRYPHLIADIVWVPGAAEAIRWANEQGILVIVVTNQAGIGRGYYDTEQFMKLTFWMVGALAAQSANIDGIYFCPHHPDAGCACRKPQPGMLNQAIEDWNIDPSRSLLIGDKQSDLDAATNASIRSAHFLVDEHGPLSGFVRAAWED